MIVPGRVRPRTEARSRTRTENAAGPKVENRTIEQLLFDYYGGDDYAFELLFNLTKHRIRAYLMSRGIRDCEDLLQELFLRVAGSRHPRKKQFRGTATLTTWLFKIANRLMIDFGRRCDARIKATDISVVHEPLSASQNPEQQLLIRERKRVIRTAVHRLPHSERQVVDALVQNKSARAAAEELKVSSAVFSKRRQRGFGRVAASADLEWKSRSAGDRHNLSNTMLEVLMDDGNP